MKVCKNNFSNFNFNIDNGSMSKTTNNIVLPELLDYQTFRKTSL